MNNQEQQNRQHEGGSGSAENQDRSRHDQLHTPTSLNQEEKDRISAEIDNGKTPVAGLKDLGAMSGRDDAAGGSGDGMENTSTAKGTKRL